MKKALIYTRAKIDLSDCRFASIEAQTLSCKEFAQSLGIAIIGVRSDIIAIGTERDVSAWKAIVNDKKPNYDCVLIHDFSRIGRSVSQTVQDRAKLKEKGVRVISVTESGTEQEDDFMLSLLEELQKEMNA